MKKLIVFLISSLFIFVQLHAQIPVEQFKNAPTGGKYCFESNEATGAWKVVLCSTGGGGGTTTINYINNGDGPPTNPPIGDSNVYVDNSTGDIYSFNPSTNIWTKVGNFDARNGMTYTNGYAELGGEIIKNTIVEDATDSYDILFKKGSTSFGFQETDLNGYKSFNITDIGGNDSLIASVRNGFFEIEAKTGAGNSTNLQMNGQLFGLYRDHKTTGDQFSLGQIGSSFAINLTNGNNSSAIGFTGAGNIQMTAKNGSDESNITVNGGIEIRTPSIFDGTAEDGMFLKLTNKQFGDSEWSDELSSDYIVTPTIDYDLDGNNSNTLTESLIDIKNALLNQPTNTDNQALGYNATTGEVTLTNSPSFFLPTGGTSGGDNWGAQTVVTDGVTMGGNGTGSDPVRVLSTTAEYNYSIGTKHDGAYVTASTEDVTYSRIGNRVTITKPPGTKLHGLLVRGSTNNHPSDDHIYINIDYQGETYNSTYENYRGVLFELQRTYSNRDTPGDANSSQWVSTDDDPPYIKKATTGMVNGKVQVKGYFVRGNTTNYQAIFTKL